MAATKTKSVKAEAPVKRELSSGGLTNEETASDGSAEPNTPTNERAIERRKPKGEMEYLLYIAEWYNSNQFSKSDPERQEGLLVGKRRTVKRKEDPYIAEQRAEAARVEANREASRAKLAEKRRLKEIALKKAEAEKKKQERLKVIEKQKAKTLAKKLAAKKKKKEKSSEPKRSYKRKSLSSPSSSSATPDPESSNLKKRKTKEVETELVDGYRPFLQASYDDVEIPIRGDFFAKEVYEGTNDKVESLEYTPASTTIRNYLKKYKKYQGIEPHEIELNSVVFPQLKEPYYLMESRDFELDPLEEIGKLMESLSITYFPEEYKLIVYNPLDPYNSIAGRLSKGMDDADQKVILDSIKEYNDLVTKIHQENGFIKHLKEKKTISRAFVHELLNQMYSRAVSPSVQRLRKYEAFSNNVYGELLPNFLSKAFDQVGLSSKSTFIDLGSGVGNVTIQAALEYGCESYGCEVMENASDLADLQHQVFNERCKLFGLNPGKVGFFNHQSFVDNPEVEAVVSRCDVILVNNFIFTPDLNREVIKLFRNLKAGTKIISLKNLVPAGHVVEFDDIENIINKFKVECFALDNGSVSWTDRGGIYFVSEIMGEINPDFLTVYRGRRSNPKAESEELVVKRS